MTNFPAPPPMSVHSFGFSLIVFYAVGIYVAISPFARAGSPDELWKLVAQSQMIVVGTPTVPADQIQRSERSGQYDYIAVPVRVKESLKGDSRAEIMVRYFTRPAWYSPAPRTLLESNDKQSILFLLQVDTQTISGTPETYFAGHTRKAIQPYSEELCRRVRDETLAQKRIIDDFARNFRPADEPSSMKVRSLIEATLDRRTETRAFADLEALGESGVPALIMFMDDRRELPVKEIQLRNGPGAFESSRTYGPQVVADAIAAILNQVTGEDFGTIVNGGSERERRAVIEAWRVYLHRKRFGTDTYQADATNDQREL